MTKQSQSAIRKERWRHNWTQADLASLMGVTPATIGRWERGERDLSLQSWNALATVFNKDKGWAVDNFFEQEGVYGN